MYLVALNEGKKSEEIASFSGISKEILQRTISNLTSIGFISSQWLW
jgi:DNA-binding IscR family transcriptional regulator